MGHEDVRRDQAAAGKVTAAMYRSRGHGPSLFKAGILMPAALASQLDCAATRPAVECPIAPRIALTTVQSVGEVRLEFNAVGGAHWIQLLQPVRGIGLRIEGLRSPDTAHAAICTTGPGSGHDTTERYPVDRGLLSTTWDLVGKHRDSPVMLYVEPGWYQISVSVGLLSGGQVVGVCQCWTAPFLLERESRMVQIMD
jgi:hypothetical protein